jgi:hypothetical protein
VGHFALQLGLGFFVFLFTRCPDWDSDSSFWDSDSPFASCRRASTDTWHECCAYERIPSVWPDRIRDCERTSVEIVAPTFSSVEEGQRHLCHTRAAVRGAFQAPGARKACRPSRAWWVDTTLSRGSHPLANDCRPSRARLCTLDNNGLPPGATCRPDPPAVPVREPELPSPGTGARVPEDGSRRNMARLSHGRGSDSGFHYYTLCALPVAGPLLPVPGRVLLPRHCRQSRIMAGRVRIWRVPMRFFLE